MIDSSDYIGHKPACGPVEVPFIHHGNTTTHPAWLTSWGPRQRLYAWHGLHPKGKSLPCLFRENGRVHWLA
jgi:hypothetical protein